MDINLRETDSICRAAGSGEERLEKKLFFAIFAAVFIIMFLFTCFTPMMVDDFSYSLSFADESRITSIWDIIPSMQEHRMSLNGRIVAHSLVQLFLLFPTKMIFNIFNGANATLLLFLLYRFYRGSSRKNNVLLLLCGAFSLWIFMPVFAQLFFWLTGSVNYSWAFTFQLAFLYPFFSAYTEKSGSPGDGKGLWKTILFCILGFFAGAYSENASCATLFMCFCFLLLTALKRKKLPAGLTAAFACGCVGFASMMLAPA